MKELIVNALKAAGKPTDGKTDAELMDAYTQMKADEEAAKAKAKKGTTEGEGDEEIDPKTGKPKKKPATATNHAATPAWFLPFAEDLAAVKSGLAANADQEKGQMRAAVKTKFGMSDIAVNALDGDPLKELYAQCHTSTGLNGSFMQATNTQSVSEMPE